MPIPFNRPTTVGKESEYMQQALQNNHISGDGQFTKKAHALLEDLQREGVVIGVTVGGETTGLLLIIRD